MPVRLFVGNLPYDTTEAELREHLSAAGSLSSVYLPINKETGKPRGFAFVEFPNDSEGQDAIRRFNNQPFKGRNLSISEARAREARPMGDMRPRGEGRPPMGRPPMGAGGSSGPSSRPFTPRFDRPAPAEPFTPGGGGNRKTGRSEAPPRRKTKRPQGEAGFRGERGPKRPIREKPGGRLYEGFEDETATDEELLEDDFSRSADDDIIDVDILDVEEDES